MRRASNRLPEPSSSSLPPAVSWTLLALLVVTLGTVWVAMHVGTRLAGEDTVVPMSPIDVALGLAFGRLPWPGVWGWVVLGAQLLALALVGLAWLGRSRLAHLAAILGGRARPGRASGPSPRSRTAPELVDQAAQYMARGREIERLTPKAAAATAQRLGMSPSTAPGLPIGLAVAGRTALVSGWEDMRLTMAGPRTGKTTSLVIPQVLEAPGAVLVTSNKRDVVDDLRAVRAAGGRAWVFDPQDLLNQQGSPQQPAQKAAQKAAQDAAQDAVGWWWNPLETVRDEASAADLAEHFASGSRTPGARTDAFFDGQAKLLLAALLLAAAMDGEPISRVWRWLTRPTDRTPVEVLARHGVPLQADLLEGIIDLHDRTRGGIYSSAQQMASCLTDRRLLGWITPPGTPEAQLPGQPRLRRERFVAAEFVASSQPRTGTWGEHIAASAPTLFSLSREGSGSAGPVVLALTAAVAQAAESYAAASPRGRLPVPMVVVLDEAANVCRWSALPDLFSHYGSRGILIDVILQSYPQGVEVWGKTGMAKLWSAANIKVIGGGAADAELLTQLVDLIGDRDRQTTTVTFSSGGGSGRSSRGTNQQLRREPILTKADLASLPMGRVVVLASGMRPVLVRTVPWFDGPHAQRMRQVALEAAAQPSAHAGAARSSTARGGAPGST